MEVNFRGMKLSGKNPIYIQISEFIKRQIYLGFIKDGDVLPSRRELAAFLEVNPNTVQKAYHLMEEEGFIVTPQNAQSTITLNSKILEKIKEELVRGLVQNFIDTAKENHISFKEVISLITELWE